MVEESSKSNLLDQMVDTLIRGNGSRSSMKLYSASALTIALIFGIIQPTTSLAVPSTFSGTLSVASPAFIRPNGNSNRYYFYEALQFKAFATGSYTFTSSSSTDLDTYGCLYQRSFDPSNSSQNVIACDDGSGEGAQFLFTSTLQSGETYFLIVTTPYGGETGNYLAIANGPGAIAMTPIEPVISIFKGGLSTTSSTFTPPDENPDDYHYQAMHVTNFTQGMYTLRSSDTTMGPYGYFYNGSFDPTNPLNNLAESDSFSGGDNNQFLIAYYLHTNSEYNLVVSTFYPGGIGNYSVIATGPGSLTLVPFTIVPFDGKHIPGIAYSAFVVGVVMLSILTHKRSKT